jgi:hypothetical protein
MAVEAAAEAPQAAASVAHMRVALVDDEEANRRLGLRMLARLGIPATHVVALQDGARGSWQGGQGKGRGCGDLA